MIDGIELSTMTILATMGIYSDGKKHILGIAEGGSENSIVAKGLFEDLIQRGLNDIYPRLYVIDVSKVLKKANISMTMTLAYRELNTEGQKTDLQK